MEIKTKIKIKYQKNTATATTIQALFCRIHLLWNSTEGNTAIFPEIRFMFPETEDEIQRFAFQLTTDKYMRGWRNYCSGLLRKEKGHLELEVKTQAWPQAAAHPPLSSARREQACDSLPKSEAIHPWLQAWNQVLYFLCCKGWGPIQNGYNTKKA